MEEDIVKTVLVGVLVVGFIGFCAWTDKKARETPYQEPVRIKDTVTVYGKSPSGYRQRGFIDVVNRKGKRYVIMDYYSINTPTCPGAYATKFYQNPEANIAERGDMLVVESRDNDTYEILKNLTALGLVYSGR